MFGVGVTALQGSFYLIICLYPHSDSYVCFPVHNLLKAICLNMMAVTVLAPPFVELIGLKCKKYTKCLIVKDHLCSEDRHLLIFKRKNIYKLKLIKVTRPY